MFNSYPYTNFHELNLAYFLQQFAQIFQQWNELYTTLQEWKVTTTEELETWKAAQEAAMEAWESDLLADLAAWKSTTEDDISAWETATLSALDDWKDAFETLFDSTFSDLSDIKTDAEAARDAAIEAQEAAEAAAATLEIDTTLSISGRAADALVTGNDIRALQTAEDRSTNHITPTVPLQQGTISNTGSNSNSSTRVRTPTGSAIHPLGCVDPYITVHINNNDLQARLIEYDDVPAASAPNHSTGRTTTFQTSDFTFDVTPDYYYRLVVAFVDGSEITPSDVSAGDIVVEWRSATDKTLTKVDVPADASAVGDLRETWDRNLTSMNEETISPEWYDGGIAVSGGNTSDYNGIRIRSQYFSFANGLEITIPEGMAGRIGLYTSVGGAEGFLGWLDDGFWTGTRVFNNPAGDIVRMLAMYDQSAPILPAAGDSITIRRYSFNQPIIAIPQNSDLNDYKTPGRFYSQSTSVTVTLSNCPLKDTAFNLEVVEARSSSSGAVRQMIFKNDRVEEDGFWMRYVYSNYYGPWNHYLPYKAMQTPEVFYNNVQEYAARSSDNVVAKFRVGTFNVAHYRYNQNSPDYISTHLDAIEKWRKWVMNSNLDFLFLCEDSQYIDSSLTMAATKYLYNPYFYENDTVVHSHRILTKSEFTTSPLSSVTVQNVNPNGTNTAYYIDWCISNVQDIGRILMAVIHNFPSGPTSIGTEEQVKQNRTNYYNAIKTLLTDQAANYDYVIIAGDTNLGNYIDETIENTEYDMALISAMCEDTNTHLVNGDVIGWFKTIPSYVAANRPYDNIIVSNNIRVERIECNPYMYEELWSDHIPVIAEISLLG